MIHTLQIDSFMNEYLEGSVFLRHPVWNSVGIPSSNSAPIKLFPRFNPWLRSETSDTRWSQSNISLLLLVPLVSEWNVIYLLILYSVGSLLDAKCNLLGYRRHHSVRYTGLFTTPLVVITISLSSDPLMSCLEAVLGSLLCSFFYLCLSWMLTANWLTGYSLFSTLFRLFGKPLRRKRQHPYPAVE
jgi:hypothetical protein